MPDEPEVHGLQALMVLNDARRAARFEGGEFVLLADQDRSRWDAAQIAGGREALDRALALQGGGPYVVQAASRRCTWTSRTTVHRSPHSTESSPG
jgi:RNA polymerase sigma-70 factor (ECF subfamily)